MFLPLSEIRGSLSSWLPAALAPPEAVARAERLLELLPEDFESAAFECRLGQKRSRVDFLACVTRKQGRERFLSSLAEHRREGRLSSAAWERVHALCTDWADPASPLYASLPLIWLEFDDAASGGALAEPFAFLCLQPEYPAPPPLPEASTSPIPPQLLQRGLATLMGRPLAPDVDAQVRRCFAQLPAGGYILHASSLASRGLDAVRLVLSLPVSDVPDYLKRVGWPGPPAELTRLLAETFTATNRVGFALDAGARVHPAVGLEYYWTGEDPRWAPLLETLIRKGACSPELRQAVLSWPGSERRTLRGEQWPLTLDRRLQLKLVYRPGEPLEAKAYLGFTARFSLFD